MASLFDPARRVLGFISTRPALYYGLRRATGKFDQRCVATDTDIVIEGYPRSANSTTTRGFIDRQPAPVQVAHHLHQPAQLLRAVQWGIPAVMLIRSPQDAVLSNIALAEEGQRREGRQRYVPSFVEALGRWCGFYRATLPHTDELVIAPFEEVTADISSMIQTVNNHFGTAFAAGPPLRVRDKLGYHTEAKHGYHALPTALRDQIKRSLNHEFARQLEDSPRLCRLLEDADALHREILKRHELSRTPSVAFTTLQRGQISQ